MMKASTGQFTPAWVADAVFYQIFPDRFCNGDNRNDPPGTQPWGETPTRENFFGGDLQGLLEKLDYLEGLGINALYLNPIFKARTNHRYDTSDYFEVDPALGDKAMLKRLTDELHNRGMHLILDGVFNHCGSGFAPFMDVLEKGEKSAYRDWFIARSYPLTTDPLNFLTCGGCTYLPKLNHAHRPVREFILEVARFWLQETGMDGWRLDVPFKIPLEFWREFRTVVKAVNPQAYLVGEVWREAGPWIRGDVFDGVTNYRLRDLIFDYTLTGVLDGEDFGYELLTLLDAHGPAAFAMLNLLDSHDTARVLTSFNGDIDKLHIALTAVMTLPGAPLIYYGDETGMFGETDPDCRRCFSWEESRWNESILNMTRSLVDLRRQHPALRHGLPQKLAAFNGIFAYRMAVDGDEVLVLLNPRESVPAFNLPVPGNTAGWLEITTGREYFVRNGQITIDSVPYKCALIFIPLP